ncbi:amidoligase family protein [Paenibacillus sp. GYB003]|uniref:amidoligase family protein n=1 Tax=Paenibacillus sp. GYB003 TaxID=2994392 RepID=UPI002F96724E
MGAMELHWTELKFGVEIEFVGCDPKRVELLPGWVMSLDEKQVDMTGADSGSELKPPPLRWEQRDQIRVMLDRLKAQGAEANWSCGLHVHVGAERWGPPIVPAMVEAALTAQDALRQLVGTSEHRLLYCPPITREMAERFAADPTPEALRHKGRPQSHRCGINAAAWYDTGTIEIRYANGSLDYGEILNTVELCLRFVAAVGAGRRLPNEPRPLAAELGAPADGYPPTAEPPRWFKERMWLEELLLPVFAPIAAGLVPDGEVHHIVPTADGLLVAVEDGSGALSRYVYRPGATGWEWCGTR